MPGQLEQSPRLYDQLAQAQLYLQRESIEQAASSQIPKLHNQLRSAVWSAYTGLYPYYTRNQIEQLVGYHWSCLRTATWTEADYMREINHQQAMNWPGLVYRPGAVVTVCVPSRWSRFLRGLSRLLTYIPRTVERAALRSIARQERS